ncbi:TetR/AcrR family transcriptional regulator [Sorangium sp. So ce131]|uniref:TetR/AcrR family transcriptional regulator n=1 Tax=Sorangium sp. So ce131 TaxID=3133282 RepID=UPI003F638911
MNRPVKKPSAEPKPRGRPRSQEAKRAILEAARVLLAEGGPGAVTMEAVAARAGVGKPTVYRWWPDRHAVAMAALMEEEAAQAAGGTRRSAVAALREQLRAIARRFATSTGRHVASMIAASEAESELSKAFRNHFVLARRAEGKELLARAIEQEEIRGDLDVEVALDLLYGPLFFRLLMGHAALDERFMDQVLDEALRGMKVVRRER